MRAWVPGQGGRARPWLLPVALSVLILGIAAYLLVRRWPVDEPDPRMVPVLVRLRPAPGSGRWNVRPWTIFWDEGGPDSHPRS